MLAPIFRGPDEGDTYMLVGETLRVILAPEETGRAYELLEASSPPGGGAPLHAHDLQDEMLHFLEGEFLVLVGGQTVRYGPGGTAFIPRGTPHGHKYLGDSIGRCLSMFTPCGFIALCQAVNAVPADELTAARLAEIVRAHHSQVLDPGLQP